MRDPETHVFGDDGRIPGSPLPVLVYHDVAGARDPGACIALFAEHGWRGAWRNGIFSYHHFHSTAHEVLGIVAGSASVALGGSGGAVLEVTRGDVLVLPAGTGHCNAGASDDLLVVGAYPGGVRWDVRRGEPSERDEVAANLAAVPLPDSDPVAGPEGPLTRLWK